MLTATGSVGSCDNVNETPSTARSMYNEMNASKRHNFISHSRIYHAADTQFTRSARTFMSD